MAAKSSTSNVKLVRELAEILKETDLTEIEYKTEGLKLRVKRGGDVMQVAAPLTASMAAPATVPSPAAASSPAPAAAPAPAASTDNAETSPMVGTAYVRPSPDADPFAKVGDNVKAGDTILLIEAMKTFNPITASTSGTLTAVHVEDAQGVEFGDPLFTID